MTREQKILNQPRAESRLIVHNACNLKLKPNKIKMKEGVMELRAKDGTLYVVRVSNDDRIIEVLSVSGFNTDRQPKPQTVPDGRYQAEGVFVNVSGNKISMTKNGIQPTPVRKPLSGIAKVMADMTKEREAEIKERWIKGY